MVILFTLPVTSHQSPVTSHQSPVTSHQSPVPNPQSWPRFLKFILITLKTAV
ncbi:hypothetical protein H5968_17930 [Sphaerospermopsis sp. LEGE 00249]|uniref:hypothetical protein n=1 Tax=Sphaerospermopsis sp. LEGE 00249 TaxID=1380707 RepID=UPI00164EB557|nr:hypothetical protein [Sphaerospermopsis sp. LEGE 00249]MBC5796983.1 hypothetical protein [Sphaerospermopsis sp. LEGE 00249]